MPVHLKRIVCVDDNVFILKVLKWYLKSRGYVVVPCLTGKQALDVISKDSIDGVVVDFQMPEMNGGEVAAKIRVRRPRIPIIMFSGDEHIPPQTLGLVDQFVLKGQADDFLSIADSLDTLLATNSRRKSLHSRRSQGESTGQSAVHSQHGRASSRRRIVAA